jgi:hypothetical protein
MIQMHAPALVLPTVVAVPVAKPLATFIFS